MSTPTNSNLETAIAEPVSVYEMRKHSALATLSVGFVVLSLISHYFWDLPMGLRDYVGLAVGILAAVAFYLIVYNYWVSDDACIAIKCTKPFALLFSQAAGFTVVLIIGCAWVWAVPQLRGVKPGIVGNLLMLFAIAFVAYNVLMAINGKILKFSNGVR